MPLRQMAPQRRSSTSPRSRSLATTALTTGSARRTTPSPATTIPKNFVRNGQRGRRAGGLFGASVADEAIGWLKQPAATSQAVFPLCLLSRAARADRRGRQVHEALSHRTTRLIAASRQHHANGRCLRPADAGARRRSRLRDNTFVMFTSDNGPAITPQHPHGSAGPLRDEEGLVYRRRHSRAGHDPLAGQNVSAAARAMSRSAASIFCRRFVRSRESPFHQTARSTARASCR